MGRPRPVGGGRRRCRSLAAPPTNGPAATSPSIVPYAPGGSTDPISRKYSELLEKQFKVKVIVENKPGASATIGTGAVIRVKSAAHDRPRLEFVAGLPAAGNEGLAWKDTDYQSVVKLVDLPAILAVPAESA